MSPFETTSVSITKFDTPESDGFVADSDTSFREQIFDITIAQVESLVEPHRVTDDVGRKPVTLIKYSSLNYRFEAVNLSAPSEMAS